MNVYKYKALKRPILYFSMISELNKLYMYNKDISENRIWYRGFKKFLLAQPDKFEVVEGFYVDDLININKKKHLKNERLKVVTIVKNDILKMKNFIKYHRNIGIKHFIILDNNSTDGTKEWLETQEDVDLYYTKETYTSNRREAWINKLISFYGFNKWYLILDSDELFTYLDQEYKNIYQFVNRLEKDNYKRVRCIMLDMYAEDDFYNSDLKETNYVEKCEYFDTDSYVCQSNEYLDLVTGGPRNRIFGISPWLTKYSLIYFEAGDVQGNSHFPFPFHKNKKAYKNSYLRHYKFLPSEIKKYEKIVSDGNYYNGSEEYKRYIDVLEDNSISFIYSGSKKYNTSKDLLTLENILSQNGE